MSSKKFTEDERKHILQEFETLTADQKLPRKVAAQQLNVSLSTIGRWTRKAKSHESTMVKPSEQYIFISHRHEDKAIADKIREALIDWGIKYPIIQTSHYENAIRSSNELHEELRKKLNNTILQIIVFTTEEADWSYVTWEYGVTERPNNTLPNYVIFECGRSEILPVFRDRVRYKVTPESEDDILRFTHDLYFDDCFFRGEKAFDPSVDQDTIRRKASGLYNELMQVVPSEKSSLNFRWAILSIILEPDTVKQIRGLEIGDTESAGSIIEAQAKLEIYINTQVDRLLRYFGFGNLPEQMLWSRFIDNWKTNMGFDIKSDEINDRSLWINDLKEELYRCIHDQAPQRIGNPFFSADRKEIFQLIVPRVRRYSNCRMIF